MLTQVSDEPIAVDSQVPSQCCSVAYKTRVLQKQSKRVDLPKKVK